MADFVKFDARALTELGAAFRRVAPESYKATQKVVRAVALEVLESAKGRASYSSRIPASGKVRMVGLNAKVSFGGDAAPDAAPIENRGKGHVRHPLWGNRDYWYENPQPAFLAPSLLEKSALIDEALGDAVEAATTIVLGER